MSSSNYDNSNGSFELIPDGTITSVPEFYAASCRCGLKRSDKSDICIIYTPLDTCCSGVFTKNKFPAAPVTVCRELLKKTSNVKAVVVNSGVANACTGEHGYADALKMVDIASSCLNVNKENVLISSTGVIGKQLPMKKIEEGIRCCSESLSPDGGHGAAGAILTTDKAKKEIAVKIIADADSNSASGIVIGGIAKGSGMIAPNMATMLCFAATNVKISKDLLGRLLVEGVENSFNSITVDGCQSTNDMVLIQANGQSGVEIKNEGSKYYNKFKNALFFILQDLAKKIVKDGEGATKLIEINITGAASKKGAKEIGMGIANSLLFKTAMFGKDLNWGRINAAIGSTDCYVDPDKVDVYLDDILIVKSGIGIDFDKRHADKIMKNDEIKFTVNLNIGSEERKIWTTDISYDYVKINSLYRT